MNKNNKNATTFNPDSSNVFYHLDEYKNINPTRQYFNKNTEPGCSSNAAFFVKTPYGLVNSFPTKNGNGLTYYYWDRNNSIMVRTIPARPRREGEDPIPYINNIFIEPYVMSVDKTRIIWPYMTPEGILVFPFLTTRMTMGYRYIDLDNKLNVYPEDAVEFSFDSPSADADSHIDCGAIKNSIKSELSSEIASMVDAKLDAFDSKLKNSLESIKRESEPLDDSDAIIEVITDKVLEKLTAEDTLSNIASEIEDIICSEAIESVTDAIVSKLSEEMEDIKSEAANRLSENATEGLGSEIEELVNDIKADVKGSISDDVIKELLEQLKNYPFDVNYDDEIPPEDTVAYDDTVGVFDKLIGEAVDWESLGNGYSESSEEVESKPDYSACTDVEVAALPDEGEAVSECVCGRYTMSDVCFESGGFFFEANPDGVSCTLVGIGGGSYPEEMIIHERTSKRSLIITAIGKEAFKDRYITKITLPETIVRIERHAFQNTPLTEFVAPESLKELGRGVFMGCEKLKKVTLPSVTVISACAFYNCTALKQVDIPHVIEIGESAFAECSTLECFDGHYYFESHKLEKIGPDAFLNCKRFSCFFCKAPLKSVAPTAFRNAGIRTFSDSNNTVLSDNIMLFFGSTPLVIEAKEDIISGTLVKATKSSYNEDYVRVISSGAFADYNGYGSIWLPSTVSLIMPDAFTRTVVKKVINPADGMVISQNAKGIPFEIYYKGRIASWNQIYKILGEELYPVVVHCSDGVIIDRI